MSTMVDPFKNILDDRNYDNSKQRDSDAGKSQNVKINYLKKKSLVPEGGLADPVSLGKHLDKKIEQQKSNLIMNAKEYAGILEEIIEGNENYNSSKSPRSILFYISKNYDDIESIFCDDQKKLKRFVYTLIQKEPDWFSVTYKGYTVMELAIHNKYSGIVDILLDFVTSEMLKDHSLVVKDLLIESLRKDQLEIASLLINKMDPIEVDRILNDENARTIYVLDQPIKDILHSLKIPLRNLTKKKIINFLNLEIEDRDQYTGFNQKAVEKIFLSDLKSFFAQGKYGWFKEDRALELLEDSFCDSDDIEGVLNDLKGNDVPLKARYFTLWGYNQKGEAGEAHQVAFIRKGESLFVLNEGYESVLVDKDNSKYGGVVCVDTRVLDKLLRKIKKGVLDLEDASTVLKSSSSRAISSPENIIRAVDMQWIDNCAIATMRLLLRELFLLAHMDEGGQYHDCFGRVISDAEETIMKVFRVFSLYQRVKIVKEFQDMLILLNPSEQKKEIMLLRMAQAKVIHLCLKRFSLNETIDVIVDDFGISNDGDALVDFIDDCLINNKLPYEAEEDRLIELKQKHKVDHDVLLEHIKNEYVLQKKENSKRKGRSLLLDGKKISKKIL